jgi:DNA-binding transcriptional MerR regulator
MIGEVLVAPTVGEISRRTGYAIHRIRYVIDSRGIRPASRAGVANVYSEADVQRIASELRRIDEDREDSR